MEPPAARRPVRRARSSEVFSPRHCARSPKSRLTVSTSFGEHFAALPARPAARFSAICGLRVLDVDTEAEASLGRSPIVRRWRWPSGLGVITPSTAPRRSCRR
jgi:hypothetical protein